MQNRPMKIAVAPCAAIVVLIGVIVFIHSFNATSAFAHIAEAMKQQAWVYAQSDIKTDRGVERRENWISFPEGIEIDRKHTGDIRYSHKGEDTHYQYDAGQKTITITSMSDHYAPQRRIALPSSPLELLEQIIKNTTENENTDISKEIMEKDGQQIEVIHIKALIDDETTIKTDTKLVIDTKTRLLKEITALVYENEGQLAAAEVRVSYPNEGPADIYAAGAPSHVEIIDQRPGTGNSEGIEIRYKVLEDKGNPLQNRLILYGGLNMDMVLIPAGQFLMGTPDTEIGYPERVLKIFKRSQKIHIRKAIHPSNEYPQHRVEVKNTFFMSQYEITCAQFRKFKREYRKLPHSIDVSQSRSKPYRLDADHQPAGVSLSDAKAFCRWLSEQTGLSVQLPCEAEWEYACRAGTQTRFFWGDGEEQAGHYANLADRSLEKETPHTRDTISADDGYPCLAPVGQFQPNDFGLYDMLGNISEWVDGTYSANTSGMDPGMIPMIEATDNANEGLTHCRGGSWQGGLTYGRCASRWQVTKDTLSSSRRSYTGFRVIITAPVGN